ncbi:hypothetical protein GALMADRAFT_241553 [Galerina marginata CBS 339.88]|uniref:DUF6533 domain-containing protein n=1 Tax=Galerina marginata (strain CBS 339.88) TaxID=685588 RepID=A0A067TM64_GALM3|nr:hypothetical protein GALMADRAFT_241553 [Galerina marginata CBS 339.88]
MSELNAVARAIWEIQLVSYHEVGALVFLMWDIMITFADEVQYIWPQNRRSPTKWVFLFTRYFGLLAQARLVSINLSLGMGTYSLDVCRMIYTSQVVFGGMLMACIQSVLMLRVYALYTQDHRIAFAMIALLVAELGFIPGAIHLTMPTSTGNMCMKPITIFDIALFGASALFPQLLVLGLTILKFLCGIRAGWGKIPIVSRLVRDDIILVSVIVCWVIITASLTSINTIYGYIGYSYVRFRSFLAFSCCLAHRSSFLSFTSRLHLLASCLHRLSSVLGLQLVALHNPIRRLQSGNQHAAIGG